MLSTIAQFLPRRRNRTALALSFVGFMPLLALVGCSGGGGTGPTLPTAGEIASIEATSANIDTKIRSTTSPGSDATLQAAKDYAKAQSNVEAVSLVGGSLIVKYKNAGFEQWVTRTPLAVPPADVASFRLLKQKVLAQLRLARSTVGNRKAVIVNGLYDDPGFDHADTALKDAEEVLQAAGFQVQTWNGGTADLTQLKRLSDYSVVLMLGHGGRGSSVDGTLLSSPYSVQTGQLWGHNQYSSDWVAGRITKMTVNWGDTEESRKHNFKSFVAITGKFWSHHYSNHKFNNTLFMNMACSSTKYPSFYEELANVGVKAYTGWTEDQSISPFTAWRTLALMAGGKTLGQAIDALPNSYTQDDEARLEVRPNAGREITLGTAGNSPLRVIITAPTTGSATQERTLIVYGSITPYNASVQTTISVNGQSSKLEIDSDGDFAQKVGLRSGANVIRVSAIGESETTEQITVNGQFNQDVLFTELAWNTGLNDVDLHCVPVEGANGATDDCYFAHKVSSWGGVLDVDDLDGYGPEHITARTLPHGKYKLFAHYYAPRGQTQTPVVEVAISANQGTTRIFRLPALREAKDTWEVCYVSFPSGAIEEINRYVPAAQIANARRSHIPSKVYESK